MSQQHGERAIECGSIIMPVVKAHAIMLYRNLLYTGITRAKKKVILIGQKAILFMAIHKTDISKRNTLLGTRICMYYKAFVRSAGLPVREKMEGLQHAG